MIVLEYRDNSGKRWAPRLKPLSRYLLMCSMGLPSGVAAGLYVNPSFLSDDTSAVADLSSIINGAEQPAGTYQVDLYLNSEFVRSQKVTFSIDKDTQDLVPCFTTKGLEELGVNLNALPPGSTKADTCVPLSQSIPGAVNDFDAQTQQLKLTIPQALLNNKAHDSVAPDLWDNGITALTLNYDFSGNKTWGEQAEEDGFLSLQTGLNLGAWRLHDDSSVQYSQRPDSETEKSWEHINTYLQRPLPALTSLLTMGDNFTDGEIFDTENIRGVQLSSDDNMLPDSQRGFAPTLHGVAKSNARITVRQNGYVIYQTYVPPGAFTINDIFPSSSSGDLDMEIHESDGQDTHYTIPYASVPMMQREGAVKYNLAAGTYRAQNSQQDSPVLVEGNLLWGTPWGMTLYGGAQLSDNYQSLAIGTGVNLHYLGALSADITQAKSVLPDDSSHQGRSLRVQYAKSLGELGTSLQLSGYRYNDEGFYSFSDTTWKTMQGSEVVDDDDDDDSTQDETEWNLNDQKRGKFQVNLSQTLGEMGSLYVTVNQQTYWHSSQQDETLQLGYNTSWKGISAGVSYSHTKSDWGSDDNILSFNFSLPLSSWLYSSQAAPGETHNNAWASVNTSRSSDGQQTQNLSLQGDLLDDHSLNYNVQQSLDKQNGNGSSASANYKAYWGEARTGYNYSTDSHQLNFGMSGGIVAHRHGVTLSQHLADTNILVEAPGAAGVALENTTGIKTDSRGFAVVPGAFEYHHNRVALRADTLGQEVEVDDNVTDVVPTEGALVEASFTAHTGKRALITLLHNGKPVPFGATVTLADSGHSTLVGDDGEVYLTGLPPQGTLQISWGEQAAMRCQAHYQLPTSGHAPLIEITAQCLNH